MRRSTETLGSPASIQFGTAEVGDVGPPAGGRRRRVAARAWGSSGELRATRAVGWRRIKFGEAARPVLLAVFGRVGFLVKVAQIFHSLQSRTQRPRYEVAALPAVFTLFLVSIAGRLATLRQ
jgi:hypothetical protein